jgi:hypothetical protein
MVSYIPYWSYVRYMQAGVQCAAPTGRGVALEIEDRGGKTAVPGPVRKGLWGRIEVD